MPRPLQSKVDAATERLVAKTNALVLKPTAEVDKTELKAAIDAAEAKKEADYTAETWAPFAAALKAAKDTYANETAKQSDIETAIDDLAAATKALKEKEVVEPPVEPANKTKLNAAITAAGKLKKADYTPIRRLPSKRLVSFASIGLNSCLERHFLICLYGIFLHALWSFHSNLGNGILHDRNLDCLFLLAAVLCSCCNGNRLACSSFLSGHFTTLINSSIFLILSSNAPCYCLICRT